MTPSSLYKCVALTAILISCSHGKDNFQVQSLNGEWVAKETNNRYIFPATVPGGIYTDLMNANIIENVFFGYNDNSSRWVGYSNWTYSKNFTVDDAFFDYTQVNLVFEGVDTFATIVLNNVTIGETSNMFVQYVFDVKNVLQVGPNNVQIFFRSPVEVGLNFNNEQLKHYRIPLECPPDEYRGECHVNMIRKMQASFSWDWGPAFPSVGLWKPVFLEAFNESVIRYVVTQIQEKDDDNWSVNADIYFATNIKKAVQGNLRITTEVDNSNISLLYTVDETANDHDEIIKSVSVIVAKNQVKLWWPNGYGSQPLYKTKFEFLPDTGNSDPSTKEINIGYRTVELVQDDLEKGATFYFKINGVPIFAKGSNEIPLNVLPELGQDPQTIRYLLQSAKDVHMNMLRIWGGGVYESDYFYETADELGILIWQDFMFACSLYPVREDFLQDVVAEVNHNVKRIYHHPSIVVYSGNNENEGVLANSWYNTSDNYTLYKKDYVTLYITTIFNEFNRITKGQGIYISSSPTNGKESETEGWVASNPGDTLYGDIHYYNYVLDPWSSTTYLVPRFCSEFGYQSLPFEAAWGTATNNSSDFNINSDFMAYRQHHPLGNAQMELLLVENLKFPNQSNPNFSNAFIYLSEVIYSQAVKIEAEHYRRYRSYLNDRGEGYTMGALYWQLNDVWVAPTWSSIDFTGRWKMLHYFARDMFSPVIITGHLDISRQLQLYTVNDQLNPIEDVTIIVRIYKYDSPDFKPVYENNTKQNLSAGSSQLIQSIDTDNFLAAHNCGQYQNAKNNCFFHFTIQKGSSLDKSVNISPENYLFPGKLKDSNLPLPSVQVASVKQTNTGIFEISIMSDNVALFVWLDSQTVKGRFSENGFILAEAQRTVWFYTDENITVDELLGVLTVTHLKDPRWA